MSVRIRLAEANSDLLSLRLFPHVALLKLRIVGLLVFVSLVAAIVASGGSVRVDRLVLLILAGALSSAGSAALNQFLERDLDFAMTRTRGRPLPSGKVLPNVALCIGLSLICASLVPAISLGGGSTAFVLGGTFFYVFVYTLWLKRSSCWNVPIGGIAGSCAVLAGWFAVPGAVFASAPLFMAIILLFWNQSHFWALAIARRDDYRTAGIPMLPVVVGPRTTSRAILVNTSVMVFTSIAMYEVVPMRSIYLAAALVAGALFICHNLRLVVSPTAQIGWTNFKFSGVYLLVLFLAMAIDSTLIA